MNTITGALLREKLASLKAATPLGLTYITDARARKNKYGVIRKVSTVSVFTAARYEDSINRRLAREGHSQLHFTAKPRSFGERICPALIQHINKEGQIHYYLPVHIQRAKTPLYLIEENGMRKIVRKEKVAEFLPLEAQRAIDRAYNACMNAHSI